MLTGALIEAEARTWKGVPYRHQGMCRITGVDCGGLVLAVGLATGALHRGMRKDPRLKKFAAYGREPVGTFLEACEIFFDRAEVSNLQPGCVAAMRFLGHPRHAGIIGTHPHGGLSLIHALNTEVIEHRLDRRWAKRIVAVYKFREVNYER